MLAGISYTTFPEIALGPLSLRTFGLMVGVGVVVGAWLAARLIERTVGVSRDETYSLATRMVVGGVIGARLSWVLSHLDQIDNPIDVIAVWEGGLQFSGGFIAGVIVAYPTFRRWSRTTTWRSIDGYAYGLTIGLAFGRVGCYSVGEHFGKTTGFFLGTTYQGGDTREGLDGTAFETPAQLQANGIGTTFHHTALYEFVYLLVLFALLTYLIFFRKNPSRPGTVIGVFCLFYGLSRFLSDFLRVNDNTVLGLTGAQYLMLALLPTSMWILFRVRPQVAALEAAEAVTASGVADSGADADGGADADTDADTDSDERDADDPSDSADGGAGGDEDRDYPTLR